MRLFLKAYARTGGGRDVRGPRERLAPLAIVAPHAAATYTFHNVRRALGGVMDDTSAVVQDYLQTIHYMTRDGERVISARLAERLGVTPATVAATLQRMIRDDLIT